MKNKNTIIWILAVISTFSTTALVTLSLIRPAAPEFKPFHHNNNECVQNKECDSKMMQRLNLNEEQKELFINQRKAHHAKVDPIFDSLRCLRSQLFAEVDKDTPDTLVINTYITKISEQETFLQKEGVANMLSMKEFLDPVQMDTLISIFSKAMMPMRKGMHKDEKQHCNSNK